VKQFQYIYTNQSHKWGLIYADPNKLPFVIDTNEYVILSNQEAMLLDPGGSEIFPEVFSALSTEINPHHITHIFASHQDPDIISSLSLWLEINPNLKCFISRIWSTFIPHFGGDDKTLLPVADAGMKYNFNGIDLQFIPAHYLHSSGNFHLYDEKAKILFSGDMGAALLPDSSKRTGLYVENFDTHIQYAVGFHQRWMSSNEAKIKWCERVSQLEIDMLCPQHGLIYTGKDIERFINWFSELKVGITEDN